MNSKNILDTIGNTPILDIMGIYSKLETVNPSGSIKDRMAEYIIRKAEERGDLRSGGRIIEATSGNTGISLSMISALKGYRLTAVMPESMSMERKRMMEYFGAEIILTPAEEDVVGAIKKCDELASTYPDAFLPRQFENPDNIEAHRVGFAKEIMREVQDIDVFVAGIGTGGTLIGTAKKLKKANPNIRIVGVEPEESAVLSGKEPGLHEIQGIGEGFIPKLVKDNLGWIDEIVTVNSHNAMNMSRRLALDYGILAGISSGANILASMGYGGNVVSVLPDRGERYLSIFG